MKSLQDLLYKTGIEEVIGKTSIPIASICFDSRKANPDSVFIAIKGILSDGHNHIETAIENGVIAIICEVLPESIHDGITYIRVKNSSIALAFVSDNFFDHPSSRIQLVGITGTNGKTTVATLLYELFQQLDIKVGLISTVRYLIDKEELQATHTTPDVLTINEMLSKMIENGCEYCFMEVSSHAISQHRISGLKYAGALFTNITHDHLDYHETFEQYIHTKKLLFDNLPGDSFALVNNDDKHAKVMLQNTKAHKYSYGLKSMADFKAKVIENTFTGLLLHIEQNEVFCRLIGQFNASNILAAYSVAVLLGIDKIKALTAISNLKPVEGRFEVITSVNSIYGIVDYAHTPDALENVLQTVQKIRTGNEQVICVVGCGGNRDKAKRPEMAKIASSLSDRVVLTSDNPRSENAEVILDEMQKGVPVGQKRKVLRITDRAEAIKTACTLANPGDIILVAGKGHEKYQEINGVKYPFDDLFQLKESFRILQN